MSKKQILILLILSIAGYLAYAKYNSPWRPTNVIEQAEGRVRAELKDPASAQFRNTHLQGQMVCGEVNARNSFSGYTGFKRFYVLRQLDGQVTAASKAFLEMVGDVPDFDKLYNTACPPTE